MSLLALSLPSTTSAFSTFSTPVRTNPAPVHPLPSRSLTKSWDNANNHGAGVGGGPPRKMPRLDGDVPGGPREAASRSSAMASAAQARVYVTPPDPRTTTTSNVGSSKGGIIRIKLDDDESDEKNTRTEHDTCFVMLRNSIRVLLQDRGANDPAPTAMPGTYDVLFRACQSLVSLRGEYGGSEGYDERLYSALRIELEKCVSNVANELALKQVGDVEVEDKQIEKGDLEWVRLLNNACDWFVKRINLIQAILTYLDRVYLLEDIKAPSIKELAYNLWTDRVFDYQLIAHKVQAALSSWLTHERTMHLPHPSRHLFQSLVKHTSTFSRYASIIEGPYIKLTVEYYTTAAPALKAEHEHNVHGFLKAADSMIAEEETRCDSVLRKESKSSVSHAVLVLLLHQDRLSWLTENALKDYMPAQTTDSILKLKGMYTLISRVGGQLVLISQFGKYMRARVEAIVSDPSDEANKAMIKDLLALKDFAERAIAEAFSVSSTSPSISTGQSVRKENENNDGADDEKDKLDFSADFHYAIRAAFTAGFKAHRLPAPSSSPVTSPIKSPTSPISTRSSRSVVTRYRTGKPAELLAKYLDSLLKTGQKGASHAEFMKNIYSALEMHRFSEDKDVFRTWYQKLLAKRLLMGKSASDDDERAVIQRLKDQYDPEFQMGDHMFKDLQVSADLMAAYQRTPTGRKYMENAAIGKGSVVVLQASVWPSNKKDGTLGGVASTGGGGSVVLPQPMREEMEAYERFYREKFKGRKLDFDHGLGTASLKARFDSGVKELQLSLYQAVILLLFNDADEMSFTDIKTAVSIDDTELRRTLQSLALGAKIHRVLTKVPQGKDVLDTDMFSFNAALKNTATRFRIPSIQAQETPEDNQRMAGTIAAERSYTLDAAIVRIMKAKRTLHYEALKVAVVDAVKAHFVPDVGAIKKRISDLVEQEYMERDEDDMNVYKYVA